MANLNEQLSKQEIVKEIDELEKRRKAISTEDDELCTKIRKLNLQLFDSRQKEFIEKLLSFEGKFVLIEDHRNDKKIIVRADCIFESPQSAPDGYAKEFFVKSIGTRTPIYCCEGHDFDRINSDRVRVNCYLEVSPISRNKALSLINEWIMHSFDNK